MMTITEYLDMYCEEVTPREFYRSIFPEGSLEKKGEYVEGEYTAIAVVKSSVTGKFKHKYTVTDDLDVIDDLSKTNDFCVMAPISYAGKTRTNTNARFLYAMAIDVDGVKENDFNGVPEGMWTLFHQFDGHDEVEYLPLPTYIVSSGTGIHVYYVFEKPIALYQDAFRQLYKYKKQLTWQLWTQGVTNKTGKKVEYESLSQPFRMPGTITKNGGRTRVFMVDSGKKVTMDYMNQFVPKKFRTTVDLQYKNHMSIERAKKLYPDWYQERIVEGKPKGSWVCKRDLYEWWKQKITSVEEGHRYWYIMSLATYAKKCNISYDELKEDAENMISYLDGKGDKEKNPFTEEDVYAALKAYSEDYITYPIDAISARSGIPIEKNKRNYRKQAVHLERARAVQEIDYPNGEWRNKEGRPTAQLTVYEWQRIHPKGKKIECERETGLSRHTVLKWWDS